MCKYVLIDICGTLYDSNTTMDFLEFSFWNSHRYLQYKKFISLLPIRAINRCFLHLFYTDPIRACGVHFLKGLHRDEIASLVDVFYENYLLKHQQQNIIDMIDNYRNPEYHLVLVSATLDCIAHKIAESLGISTVLSSTLEYDDNGFCTGRITTDLLFSKYAALIKERIYPPFGVVISDNLSDAKLMSLSEKNFIACHDHRRNKWLKLIRKHNIRHSKFL